jgi:hypothetical protein
MPLRGLFLWLPGFALPGTLVLPPCRTLPVFGLCGRRRYSPWGLIPSQNEPRKQCNAYKIPRRSTLNLTHNSGVITCFKKKQRNFTELHGKNKRKREKIAYIPFSVKFRVFRG